MVRTRKIPVGLVAAKRLYERACGGRFISSSGTLLSSSSNFSQVVYGTPSNTSGSILVEVFTRFDRKDQLPYNSYYNYHLVEGSTAVRFACGTAYPHHASEIPSPDDFMI